MRIKIEIDENIENNKELIEKVKSVKGNYCGVSDLAEEYGWDEVVDAYIIVNNISTNSIEDQIDEQFFEDIACWLDLE